ncbi:MAG: ferritin-like domain-containing protein [Rhodospirillaceae bacterium]|jgi:rubrerythrin|nr:ferritin-like domain-containing protein [Rhodospirillaceae bacterium]
MKRWTLDDIPWDRFDPAKVDPEVIKVVKAASMVEANGGTYAHYLAKVFYDDPAFQDAAFQWASEEEQHGAALARWAELADPTFDFSARFEDFKEKVKLPDEIDRSVRGTRTGELVARCIVEVGTSSYYSALGNATDEPVLKEMCRRIAADELAHYKLFYKHMKRYIDEEQLGFWRRLRVALGRVFESEDDELAYAYYAANHLDDGPYDRRVYARAYARRVYPFFRRRHVELGIAMILKAIGVRPRDWLTARLARLAHGFIRMRAGRLARQGA